ncbi:adp-ribosylation-like factor 6-interacting protein [Anaeramoeba flamelloides]|uniref:Adp-ribosylation-like factor 6-interacting protein n=1 Tax=Anaeramoeba flamelloides TaxID=1746091 RepID=A0AAV7Z243_9EUKA|nr:adp-ribosylation-like factor 6-interacting protein [Anaeramoeba flamelloides]
MEKSTNEKEKDKEREKEQKQNQKQESEQNQEQKQKKIKKTLFEKNQKELTWLSNKIEKKLLSYRNEVNKIQLILFWRRWVLFIITVICTNTVFICFTRWGLSFSRKICVLLIFFFLFKIFSPMKKNKPIDKVSTLIQKGKILFRKKNYNKKRNLQDLRRSKKKILKISQIADTCASIWIDFKLILLIVIKFISKDNFESNIVCALAFVLLALIASFVPFLWIVILLTNTILFVPGIIYNWNKIKINLVIAARLLIDKSLSSKVFIQKKIFKTTNMKKEN